MILQMPEISENDLRSFALQLGVKEGAYDEYRKYAETLASRYELPLELTWNPLSIAMYSVERSEHCDYPHSRQYIRQLVVVPGKEDKYPLLRGAESGGFEIPNDMVVLFKIESHNHPSQSVPKQGAATGIGGIIRDILAMGARPVALMDPLYFGNPSSLSDKWIATGVIEGVGWYGNCVGLPNLGGQIIWDQGHENKPLVNVLCLGIARQQDLMTAKASGPGNVVLIVGNDTGPDGIGGASILASQTYQEGRETISAVQVGDPFRGKCLIEAYLECVQAGLVVACKDMGAAGLTCTTTEMCAGSNVGMAINLARVPLRTAEMYAHEVMMSESQERMLVIAKQGNAPAVECIFQKWGLHAAVIGVVTEQPLVEIWNDTTCEAVIDPSHMVGGDIIPLHPKRPAYLDELTIDIHSLPEPADYGQTLLQLLASPNIASKKAVWQQYDRHVGNNTVEEAGLGDAGVIRIKGTNFGLAMTTDCNPRYCYLNPKEGAKLAVAEAARNLVCTGADPVAATDCLNFGDLDDPEVAWQFEQTIAGLKEALEVLRVAVVSGNISLYNHDDQGPVWPTPTIGIVGFLENIRQHCTPAFKTVGDHIYLVGPMGYGHLEGTEYLTTIHGLVIGSPPSLDLAMEARVQNCVLQAITEDLLSTAHDCSDGGLAVAVAESAILGDKGASVMLQTVNAASLFGEDQSRIVVSLPQEKTARLREVAAGYSVPIVEIGKVGNNELIIGISEHQITTQIPSNVLAQAWNSQSPPA